MHRPVVMSIAGHLSRMRCARAPMVRSLAACAMLGALLLGTLIGVAGQAAPPRATAAAPGPAPAILPASSDSVPVFGQATHRLDAADLASWLDGMLPAALEQGRIAGAVVTVVQDGHILLAKGYGLADVARGTPMDPARTLVRPGSTSKLFTWTAVMQLAEQGKLDLNADVNRYLDFRVGNGSGRPITLTDLMNHRAGFEEGLKDAIVTDPAALQRLDVFLKRHVRPVLFTPGSVPAYSNYGTALAGYIVQRVSGQPFNDYVTRHIFEPLGMRHSTFAQPLPAIPGAAMARGYMTSDDAPVPFELISFAPAGSLSATATDMARFMIAHLQDGQLGDARILRAETARLMHSPSRGGPAGFDTMAHGFFLAQRNGRAVLGHGGDTIVFHSDLALIPQEKVGIFVSFNSRGQGDAVYGVRERLIDGFMARYFPSAPIADPAVVATARDHGERIAGRYETSRRVQSGFISLFYVLQGQEVITLNPDATIGLSSAPGKRFREIAPYRWRELGGERMLAMDIVGGSRQVSDSRNPVSVLQPAPLRRNASFNLSMFVGSLLILLMAAIAWPIAEGARRVHRQPSVLAGRALWARRLARIAVIADLIYLGAWSMILAPILGNQVSFYTAALDPTIRALQIAGIVPLLGVAAGVWNAWFAWRLRRAWIIRLGAAIGAAALLGVAWIAYVGGLMSYTLNY